MSVMSQDERVAAERRVREALGIGMVGAYPKATQLGPVGSDALARVEAEILGVQMYALGEIWGRPALDLKTRCFITLAALGGQYYSDQLAIYVGAALNLGISPEDVLEALLQMGVYAGVAAADNAMNVARDVFTQRGLRNPGAGADLEPIVPMSREDRNAAQKRVAKDVCIGRLGTGPDAAPLAMLRTGTWSIKAIDLPFETQEVNAIQGEYGYGEVWGRPALGYRIRSFVTMATLQVKVENDQLHFHINNALNIGITPEELHEAFMQVGVYHGGSGHRNAANVARDVFLQRGIVQPA